MSLEDMMDGKDSVTFDHCSMFIDDNQLLFALVHSSILMIR